MRRVFRLPLVFGRARLAREVDDELAFHLEMRTAQLVARGMPPDAARVEALRQFGDVGGVRDDCVTLDEERDRAMRRANLFSELRQDVGYALRMLRRDLGFTIVVVLTLALGIGANSAIFTLVNAVLLRTLPVPDADRLVAIGDPARTNSLSEGSQRTDLLSYGQYTDLRDASPDVFSGVLASGRAGRLDVHLGDEPGGADEHPRARFVSGNYFRTLGVPAMIGRTFDGSEDAAIGAAPVATISYGYWMRRLEGDPGVVGRTLVVNGSRLTIVGVTPPSFTGEIVGTPYDLWIPLTMQPVLQPNRPLLEDRAKSWLLALGRRAPGVSFAQARERVGTIVRRSLVEHPNPGEPVTAAEAERQRVYVSSGAKGFSWMRDTYTVPLLTLMAGVVLVLLIICANVATLLLARAVARAREMGVRAALGAGRARLVRQLLTESLVLALLSAGLGLVVAWGGSRVLLARALGSGPVPPVDVGLDVTVLGFTVLVAVLAVALFGLAPAIRAARVDLASSMRSGGRGVNASALGGRAGRFAAGKLLVGAQVALSLVLLAGAALLVRSLRSVEQGPTGLDREHLLIVDVDALGRGYFGGRKANLTQEITARLAAIPGVAAVTFSENGIFSGTESGEQIAVPDFQPQTEEDSSAFSDRIGPDYARGIGGRVLQGRDISAQDVEGAPHVILVNEAFAHRFFRGRSPIGTSIRLGRPGRSVDAQIVGVITDAKDHDLHGDVAPRFYMPYFQEFIDIPGALRFEVRATGNPADLVPAVRREILAVDANLPVNPAPLDQLMRESVQQERLVAQLATGFGVLALLLAAIGLYGVMTYAVTRRTGEIGLRVALGAARGDVVRLVVLDALRVVAGGLLVGAPLAIAAARLLRSQLHGIGVADPLSFGGAVVVLTGTAAVAALLPALRASRVAPIVALARE